MRQSSLISCIHWRADCYPQQGAGFGPPTCYPLFDICYKVRQPLQILARGNYWGSHMESPGVPKITVSIYRSITGPSGACHTNVPLVYQPYYHINPPIDPNTCTPEIRTEADPERNPNILGEAADCKESGSSINETEQFYVGYSALIGGEISTGKDALSLLAYGTAEQDTCGYFRAFAGTQVPRQQQWQRPDMPQGNLDRNAGTEIIVYPQPAGNQLQVDLPQGAWILELRHASGKVLDTVPLVINNHKLN